MVRQTIDKSSSIASVGYDPDTRTLEVQFTPTPYAPKGAIYTYADVPPDVHADLLAAPSVGKFFHRAVKQGGFKFTKVA